MDIPKKISFREALQKMSLQDYIYAGIIIVFFLIVLLLFIFATQSISNNINKVFNIGDSGTSQGLNIEQYELTTKKLRIATSTASATTPIDTSTSTATSSAEISNQSATTTLDKTAITISVKNSTSKVGAAAALAKILADSGFEKPTTGSEAKLYSTTTIMLKDSKKDYESVLLDIVRQTYSGAIVTTAAESTLADATIIIGTK